jgi:UDP:flavonoid glycosyltransferase YjiC (YdhE family)
VIRDDTPGPADYARQFEGSVCLQPYERAEYADKMSSITFDALRAGAPVITVEGTSMARVVRESGAGIVVETGSAQELREAVHAVLRDYGAFHARARAAGDALRPARSWAPLIERIEAASP